MKHEKTTKTYNIVVIRIYLKQIHAKIVAATRSPLSSEKFDFSINIFSKAKFMQICD